MPIETAAGRMAFEDAQYLATPTCRYRLLYMFLGLSPYDFRGARKDSMLYAGLDSIDVEHDDCNARRAPERA